MRKVTVAATQMAVTWNREESIKNADKLVRQAAAKGAQVILIQELFETPYFCQTQDFKYLDLATYPDENPAIRHFRSVARELHVVLPISLFERHGNTQFNSVFRMDFLMQKSFISPREILDSKCGIRRMARLV